MPGNPRRASLLEMCRDLDPYLDVYKRQPLGRFGTTEEFANLAAFLISDGAGYVNGEVVTMDGGEWLQGAGEFTALGRELTEKEWEMMKPKPRKTSVP